MVGKKAGKTALYLVVAMAEPKEIRLVASKETRTAVAMVEFLAEMMVASMVGESVSLWAAKWAISMAG